ncbi:MAG: cytochrome c-type biogenesis protein CcmF [Candidatus Midichloriaceae bacterium]|jgi:cytochrome c-type biogenesis protein CcmF
MFAEIGNFFLYSSLIFLCGVIWSFFYIENYKRRVISIFWMLTLMSISISFASLIVCYIISDFSVLNVVYNSNKLKPLIYKIAASWSNHEGSMLLWIFSLALPSFLFAIFSKKDNSGVVNLALVIQAIIGLVFVIFTITTSNPFQRIIPVPVNGFGMNPLLQDIGVSFHPPILYLGYVGFCLPFSISVALLLQKKCDDWVQLIKPWVIFSWIFLTAGIATGAWWAYRELGWGGFWFWDPVENASLIPWITSVALIHSFFTTEKSNNQIKWSVLLSILTFTLVMMGTFIVRSGIISSVHSFAQDSKRGIFILLSIFFISGFALFLYAFNINKVTFSNNQKNKQNSDSTFYKLISINNILFSLVAFVIALGTIYPLIMEIFFDTPMVMNERYYNLVVPPLVVVILALCSFTTYYRYDRNSGKKYISLIALSFATTCIFIFLISNIYSLLGIFFSLILIFSTLALIKGSRIYLRLPMILAHLGFAVLILSISLYYGLREEKQFSLSINDKISFQNRDIVLTDIIYSNGQNYLSKIAVINIDHKQNVYPEIRFFPVEKQQTVEVDTLKSLFYDLYFSVNFSDNSQQILLNVQINPMINFIWISCAIIVLSGIFSFMKRVLNR